MNRRLLILLLVTVPFAAIDVRGQQGAPASRPASASGITSYLTLHDNAFLFEITFPSDWHTEQSGEDSSFFRLKGSSPKNDTFVDVYSGAIDGGFVDLAHLVDGAKNTFGFLGDEVERRRLNSSRYEVSYNNKNKYSEYSKVLYLTKENHYYILIAYSRNPDLVAAEEVIRSFRVTAKFSRMTVVFLIGTGSLLLHLLVPTIFLAYMPIRILLDDGPKGILEAAGGRKWSLLGIPFWIGVYYLLFYICDYHLASTITSAYLVHGVDGLSSELLDFGPEAFEAAGEFISEGLAEVFGFGFWPGGRIGVVLSTAVSVIINLFEIRFVLKKLFTARTSNTPSCISRA